MAGRGEVQPIKENWTAGMISPTMVARVGSDIFLAACQNLENLIPLIEGGLYRRPGGGYVANTKDNAKVILLPFIFNREQSYVIEIGAGYYRFYQNDAQIGNTAVAIASITQANPAVVDTTPTNHGINNGDRVVITDAGGMTRINNVEVTAASVTATTVELSGVDTTAGGDYDAHTASTGNISVIYELANTYTESQLAELQFDQSNDVMYIAHPDHDVTKITRTASTNWTVASVTFTGTAFNTADNRPRALVFFENALWLAGTNNDPTSLWRSVAGSFENFTIGTNPSDAFKYTIGSKRTNKIIALSVSGEKMAILTEGSEHTGGADTRNTAITPSNFRTSAASNLGSKQHRPIVAEDTTIYIQSSGRKLRDFSYVFEKDKFGSKDLTKWSNQILFDSALEIAYQDEPNSNLWISTSRGPAAIMTYREEEGVLAFCKAVLGGTNVFIESLAAIPGSDQDRVWASVKHDINGSTVRHIIAFKKRFISSDTIKKEDAFFVDSGVTFDQTSLTVTAATATNPVVLTTLSTHGYSVDDFFMPRSMGGGTWASQMNNIEFKVKAVTATTITVKKTDDVDLDGTGFGTYTASSGNVRKQVSSITSLNHLIGEDVVMWANGRFHPAVTVDSKGTATLTEFRCSKAHIGLANKAKMKMLPVEPGNQRGTSQGKNKAVHRASLRLYESLGGKLSIDGQQKIPIKYATDNLIMDQSPDLFTGVTPFVDFLGSITYEGAIEYENDKPVPTTILAVIPEYKVNP